MKKTLLFAGQMARRWRTVGAIAPSGGSLARTMARKVGDLADGQVIIELGPGTGVITRALVERFPRNPILAVEINEPFITPLRKEFPSATVVQGCASQLAAHLARHGLAPDNVGAVVSGLPLLTLPGDLPQQILASVASVLRPGRPYVQFTYSERAWRRFEAVGFERLPSKRVWWNVPPAVVLHFVRSEPSPQ
ncbi:class I SAM-dependent methyltransferase [Limnoglobus roseus]|uniref:Methyltransferase domain-containing protein n=1 Tax=Limnoglobus roseus TaxID=2598579 RepID=A0A5C1ANW9_9BACT|nr:methyltransferase domain-containing protein [Limnoglobus roseus]QEL18558.1 methyltransferase domain-containing protein [Limnoglobus roseus]